MSKSATPTDRSGNRPDDDARQLEPELERVRAIRARGKRRYALRQGVVFGLLFAPCWMLVSWLASWWTGDGWHWAWDLLAPVLAAPVSGLLFGLWAWENLDWRWRQLERARMRRSG